MIYIIKPGKRLGSSANDANEIKTHPFFKDIDWDLLVQKKIQPPFRPKITHPKDLRHFDKVIFLDLNYFTLFLDC